MVSPYSRHAVVFALVIMRNVVDERRDLKQSEEAQSLPWAWRVPQASWTQGLFS